jgi:uncharacterized membrane protein YbhN (UPF0104 family)
MGAGGALALTSGLMVSGWTLVLALPVALIWVALPFVLLGGGGQLASQGWMPARVAAFLERLVSHGIAPRDLAMPIVLCLGVNLTGLGMLAAALNAVGQEPSLTSLIVARLAAQVASHLLPVMQGVGMVELSMVGAMQSFGMHAGAATAGTLLYRMAQFWLPLSLGLLLLINLGWLASVVRTVTARQTAT